MKFETVQIHILGDVLVGCHPEMLLPWQRDVTTSPLYRHLLYPSDIHLPFKFPPPPPPLSLGTCEL